MTEELRSKTVDVNKKKYKSTNEKLQNHSIESLLIITLHEIVMNETDGSRLQNNYHKNTHIV